MTAATDFKPLKARLTAPAPHWVGDGFPVRSLFGYWQHAELISPFLMLDHAGPRDFAPASRPRGVGVHPHRGFETVTLVFEGEVAHQDSTGNGGVIGPGDVQWMTAGAGILHEEFHSEAFTRRGGKLEMAQLWVNLPARHKMIAPAYQAIRQEEIPTLKLTHGQGYQRLIAGEDGEVKGPARHWSPLRVYDAYLHPGDQQDWIIPTDWIALVVVLAGRVTLNGEQDCPSPIVMALGPGGSMVRARAEEQAHLLLLAGEPLNEPVVGHGPFVMNTIEEIHQAIDDFQNNRLHRMPSAS